MRWYSENEYDIIKKIQNLQPDLIVVHSTSRLLSSGLFGIPNLGTINLHPSFLPKYRGPSPEFWQYYNVDLKSGVTVHYIDSGVDTGDIIEQEVVDLPLGIKSKDRDDILIGYFGVKLLLKAIHDISSGLVPRKQQDSSQTTKYARRLGDHEHLTIINWDEWPIERVWNVLRGTEGWLKCLPEGNGLWKGQFWIIGDFVKYQNIDYHHLKIERSHNGFYLLMLKDGYIILRRKWSLISFMKYYVK
jgi:methionyl-tRNA formyltransferase